MCVWERKRERESAVCGVILYTLVAFSVWLLYYVPYMFMFVLPLVRVMGEGCSFYPWLGWWGRIEISQNLFNPATNTCRCPKSGASSTLSESQLLFWTTAVILYCWFGHKSTGGNLKRGPIQGPLWPCLVPVDPLVCTEKIFKCVSP